MLQFYRSLEKPTGQGFGWALRMLLLDCKVYRVSWPANTWLEVESSIIYICTADTKTPWLVPHDDLMANDWHEFHGIS